jgi:hypothetical protein
MTTMMNIYDDLHKYLAMGNGFFTVTGTLCLNLGRMERSSVRITNVTNIVLIYKVIQK